MNELLKNFNILIDCILEDELKRFRDFLNRNFELVNFQSPETGVSLLHYAARLNKPEFLKILINNKADVNLPDFSGETPLHVASETNALEAITVLLENKQIEPMRLDNKGRSALHYACAKKNIFVIKKLIKQGCSILQKNQFGWSPFLITIQNDDVKSYRFFKKFIMEHEENIELSMQLLTHSNNEGEGGAHIAASCGAFVILKDFKKFYNEPTFKGKLPLQYAIERDRDTLIVHMIKNGASLSSIGSNGLSMITELEIAHATHPNIKQNVFINKLIETRDNDIGLPDIGSEFKMTHSMSLQSAKIDLNSFERINGKD